MKIKCKAMRQFLRFKPGDVVHLGPVQFRAWYIRGAVEPVDEGAVSSETRRDRESLTCAICGKVCESNAGLASHERACRRRRERDL
jgi:hypothetical protein